MELDKLKWESRFDTYLTFNKKIKDFNLTVYRHITQKEWSCCISEYDGDTCDEVIINYDATLEWVLSLEKLLLEAK